MENKIQRRELLGKTLLTGIGLSLGALSLNKLYAQQMPKSTIDPKTMKFIQVSNQVIKDFTEFIEEFGYNEQLDIIKKNFNTSTSIFEFHSPELVRIETILSDKKALKIQKEAFLKNNVDILLDQAADLLDRGISDRDQWDTYASSHFTSVIDIRKFFEQDELLQEGAKNGMYDQEVLEKTGLFNIYEINKAVAEQVRREFKKIYDEKWSDASVDSIIQAYGNVAQWSAVNNINAENIRNVTRLIETFELGVQKMYNWIQRENLTSELQTAKQYLKVYEKQLHWELVNRKLRFKKDDLDRKYEIYRLKAMTDPSGVLNFRKRMKPLQERFLNDFNNAYSRLTSASKGLLEIYGYSDKLPQNIEELDFFDNCVTWTRKATNWLIGFSRLDQSFVRTFTFKKSNRATESQFKPQQSWHEFLKSGVLKFNVNESSFSNFRHVRVKGLSIFVEFENTRRNNSLDKIAEFEGMIIAEVKAPKKSFYKHINDVVIESNQSHLPTLRLSRIARRSFVRNPEMIGTLLLSNTSPFGEWELSFPQIINGDLEDLKIASISMDLLVIARGSLAP